MDSSDIPNCPGIYCIRNIVTNRIYVGSAVNLRRRWRQHLHELQHNEHDNPKLQRAFNKYGADTFVHEIVEIVLLPGLLTAREQYWFNRLRPFGGRGFNIDRIAGSRLGHKLPPKSKEKIRLANLARPPASAETRQRLSETSKGRVVSSETREQISRTLLGHTTSSETRAKISDSLVGRTLSEETCQNMSKARKGRQFSPEHRENLRLSKLGTKHSEETKQKLSEIKKGKVYPETIERMRQANLGSKKSDDIRANMSAGKIEEMKTLIVTSPTGIEYRVTGIAKFCRENGLHHSSLTQVAKGRRRHTQGWTARYPSEDAP